MSLLEDIQFRLITRFCSPRGHGQVRKGPRPPAPEDPSLTPPNETWLENAERKLNNLVGKNWPEYFRGKSAIDYGCGDGRESVQMALVGATKVIGIDISPAGLITAARFAAEAGVEKQCSFVTELAPDTRADIVATFDAFEHFEDPGAMLRVFRRTLNPGGLVLVGFGPSWYHPYGSHICPFPWAHLILSEAAIIRWRNLYWSGNPRTFRETGVHHLSIKAFRRAVEENGFAFEHFECVPIRRLAPVHSKLTREFTTTFVRAVLRPV